MLSKYVGLPSFRGSQLWPWQADMSTGQQATLFGAQLDRSAISFRPARRCQPCVFVDLPTASGASKICIAASWRVSRRCHANNNKTTNDAQEAQARRPPRPTSPTCLPRHLPIMSGRSKPRLFSTHASSGWLGFKRSGSVPVELAGPRAMQVQWSVVCQALGVVLRVREWLVNCLELPKPKYAVMEESVDDPNVSSSM